MWWSTGRRSWPCRQRSPAISLFCRGNRHRSKRRGIAPDGAATIPWYLCPCPKQFLAIAKYAALEQVDSAAAIGCLPKFPLLNRWLAMSVEIHISSHTKPKYLAVTDFLHGCAAMAMSPLIITPAGMFMGFGALAHDTGFGIVWTALASSLMFAVPGQILLMTGIIHDAALLAIALAITLTAVRYAPMIATLVPLLRSPRMRAWHIIFPAHCAVVSLWLEALRLLPGLPHERRIAFLNGMAAIFFTAGIIATIAGFYLSGAMPPLFAAALLFVTPVSFLVVTMASSRTFVEKLSFILGIALPVVAWAAELKFDMLWIGVLAGTIAYGIQLTRRGST